MIHSVFRQVSSIALPVAVVLGSLAMPGCSNQAEPAKQVATTQGTGTGGKTTAAEPKAADRTKQITNSVGMKLTLNAAQSPEAAPATPAAAPQGAAPARGEPQFSGKPLRY